jgi:hypothetical protein
MTAFGGPYHAAMWSGNPRGYTWQGNRFLTTLCGKDAYQCPPFAFIVDEVMLDWEIIAQGIF